VYNKCNALAVKSAVVVQRHEEQFNGSHVNKMGPLYPKRNKIKLLDKDR
jgi:hypothetical protein